MITSSFRMRSKEILWAYCLSQAGIYSPEADNRTAEGAEFGVGVAMSFGYNQYTGLLGGLAVFGHALTQPQVAQVCAWPYASQVN